MNMLLKPAVALMNRFSFRTKFILLFLTSTLPLAIFAYELLGGDETGEGKEVFNIALLTGSLTLLSYLYLAIYAAICNTVKQLKDVSLKMAEGDMSERLSLDNKDELGSIASSINEVSNGVGQAVTSVLTTVGVLADTSETLACLNKKSGENVAIQAQNIELAAAAMKAGWRTTVPASTVSWTSSGTSPNKPTCWHSTPPSRRRGPGSKGVVSPSSRTRSAPWRAAPRSPHWRSRT